MIPLRDDNPTTIKPVVTVALIVVNAMVFMYQLSLAPGQEKLFVYEFGAIPAVIFGSRNLPPEVEAVPPVLTIFTSMFLHGGFMHLIGNMLYLWIFGNNIEDAMGHARFIVFYIVTGVAASVAHALTNLDSTVPAIGASGAISGVLGAYLLLYPRAQVLVLVPLGFFTRVMYVPAGLVLGFWFVLQLIVGSMSLGSGGGGVAWFAHVGGFLAGMGLIGLFKRPEVPCFAPPRHPPSPPADL